MGQKGFGEPQNPETCQLALPPGLWSISQLWSSDLFPSLLCAFPCCSFTARSATEEPSARDPRTVFLQTCALVSC